MKCETGGGGSVDWTRSAAVASSASIVGRPVRGTAAFDPPMSFLAFSLQPLLRRVLVAVLALVALGAGFAVEASAAPARWPTTVDLNPGETVTASRGGVLHTFRILVDEDGQSAIAYETMPFPTTSVDKRVNYSVRVRLQVDSQEVEVVARPFQYPITVAGLRLYLDGTKEWLGTDDVYPVNIPKRIRLRFTAAGEPWGPATVRFPVGEYRWGATTYYNTWLGIVPQDVSTTYFHKGEDFGAVPDLLPVLAPEAGLITTDGTGVQTRSADGTLFWMAHMNAGNIVVSAGQRAVAGQLLGLTGNRGNGNADPHCHYDLSWEGDEPGTYPFAADAYLRDYPDAGIAVAGGYQFMWAGDTLTLDGRRSLARPGRVITGYRWILHDGTTVDGPVASLTPATEGFYSEELRVFFDDGGEERGFTQVRAFERGTAGQLPIPGFVYQYPVRGITPGSEVTIRHHASVIGSYGRTIDFGDGSPVESVAGWQPVVSHRYAAPGLYTVMIRPDGDLVQILKTSVLVEGGGSGPNRPPVIAGPGARDWRCFGGSELVVPLSGFDPDGDLLEWSVARSATHGTASIDPDGMLRYEPAAGFVGDDTFDVDLEDDRGGRATVSCSVMVRPLPVAGAAGVRIEAEDYDEGGEGVAYHDVDPRQGTSDVRASSAGNNVDIVAIDTGADAPGLKVGYTEAGEWLRYTLTVPATASHTLRLRVSNGSGSTSGDALSLRWKGEVVAGPVTVPSTGDWNTFVDIEVTGVMLAAGTDLLQLDCNTAGFDCDWIELLPVQAAPFASWVEGFFPSAGGNAAIVGAMADPDGDGLNNLLEYGLGRAPNVAEPPLVPERWTDPDTGEPHLALTFVRARDVQVVAEISSELLNWSSAEADLVQEGAAVPDATGFYETVTYRSVAKQAAQPRQFLRLRVTWP